MHHARGVLRLAAAARDRAAQGDCGGGGRVRASEAAASDAGDAAAADAPDGRALPAAAPGEGRGGGGTGSQRLTFWIKEITPSSKYYTYLNGYFWTTSG